MSQIVRNYLINGVSPVTVGGTGTTVKYFPNANGNFTSGVIPASTHNAYIFCPDNLEANGQRLSVQASGNLSIGAVSTTSPAVTVALYPVTFVGNQPSGTATVGSAIVSGTLAASGDTGVYYPWALQADIEGDNLSGILQLLSGNIVIDGATTTASSGIILTSVNFNSPVPFGLVVGVTFSVSDANATANMYQFVMQS